ncbi:hypothetical protein HZC32_03810 [Candidatus Woesearchaeota archaeon]|nr:hypothetical protein [Candidatus Woesearchaeota archaeon]
MVIPESYLNNCLFKKKDQAFQAATEASKILNTKHVAIPLTLEEKLTPGGEPKATLETIDEEKVVDFLSKQFGLPKALMMEACSVDPQVISLVPKEIAYSHVLLPLTRRGNSLAIAIADPSNVYGIDDVKFLTGFNIEVYIASYTSIQKALEKYYGPEEPKSGANEIFVHGGVYDTLESSSEPAEKKPEGESGQKPPQKRGIVKEDPSLYERFSKIELD